MNNAFYPNGSTIPIGSDVLNKNADISIPNTTPSQNGFINSYQISYAELLIRNNIGKLATLYMTFPNSNEWRDKTFKGIIEDSGRDYVLISDSRDGKWYLLLTAYLDYIIFEEQINHN